MPLSREKLLSLWNLEEVPTCDAGMQLAETFLVSCGEALDRFGEEEPEDRLAQINATYMAMVEHGDLCDKCKEV